MKGFVFVIALFLNILTMLWLHVDFEVLSTAEKLKNMLEHFGVNSSFDTTLILWDLKINLVLFTLTLVCILIIVIFTAVEYIKKRSVNRCRKAVHWKNS